MRGASRANYKPRDMPCPKAVSRLCVRILLAILMDAGAVRAQGTIVDSPATFALAPDHFIDATADITGVSATLAADHLFAEGWWYRVAGDGSETFFPDPDDQDYDGPVATLTWGDVNGRGFGAVETDTIVDAGGPSGRVTLSLTITNLSTSVPLTLDVFHMADIDLDGSENDSAALAGERLIRISDGANTAEYFASGTATYLVTRSGESDVAGLLFDDTPDEFGDTGLPFGPGDVTLGFQWETTVIPPSGSETFTVVIAVNTAAVSGTTPTSTTSSTSLAGSTSTTIAGGTTTTTTTGATTTTSRPPTPVEACENCQDDDGDGLVDFQDPDCCPAVRQGAIGLTRGKLKGRGAGGTALALSGTLPVDFLPSLPANVARTVQLARPGQGQLSCARIPTATLQESKGKMIFRDQVGALDRVTVLRGKAGSAKLVVRGKTVPFELPAPGPITMTFGLRESTAAGTVDRCAVGSAEFRVKRKGLVIR